MRTLTAVLFLLCAGCATVEPEYQYVRDAVIENGRLVVDRCERKLTDKGSRWESRQAAFTCEKVSFSLSGGNK